MNKRSKILGVATVIFMSALSSGPIKANDLLQDGKFKFATEVGYEPFEYTDANGKLVGADIELAEAVARAMGAEPEAINMPFDALLPGLAAKRFGVVWANLTPTAERLRSVDFVTYAQAGHVGMALPEKASELAAEFGLCGKRVGTAAGGVVEPLISQWDEKCKSAGKAELINMTFAGASEERLAALAGRVDFILDDSTGGEAYQRKSGGKLVVFIGPLSVQPLAIAVRKGDSAGAEVLRSTLQKLIDDGTYKKIMEKYDLHMSMIDRAKTVDSEATLNK